jgi:hypothetical protein
MSTSVGSSAGNDNQAALEEQRKKQQEEAAKKAQETSAESETNSIDDKNDTQETKADTENSSIEKQANLDVNRPGSKTETNDTTKVNEQTEIEKDSQEQIVKNSKEKTGQQRKELPGEVSEKTIKQLKQNLSRKIESLKSDNQKTDSSEAKEELAKRAPQLTQVENKESETKEKDKKKQLEALKLVQQKAESLIKEGKEAEARSLLTEAQDGSKSKALDELAQAQEHIAKFNEEHQTQQKNFESQEEQVNESIRELENTLEQNTKYIRKAREATRRSDRQTFQELAGMYEKSRARKQKQTLELTSSATTKEVISTHLDGLKTKSEIDTLTEAGDVFGASEVAQGKEYTRKEEISLTDLDIGEVKELDKHKGFPEEQRKVLDYKERLDTDIKSRQKRLATLISRAEGNERFLERSTTTEDRERVFEETKNFREQISSQRRELETRQQVQNLMTKMLDENNFDEANKAISGELKLSVEETFNKDSSDPAAVSKEAELTIIEEKANQETALAELEEQSHNIDESKEKERAIDLRVAKAGGDVGRIENGQISGNLRKKKKEHTEAKREFAQQKQNTASEVQKAKKQQTEYSKKERQIADAEELQGQGKLEEAKKVLSGEQLTTTEKVKVDDSSRTDLTGTDEETGEKLDKYSHLEGDEKAANIYQDRVKEKLENFDTGVQKLQEQFDALDQYDYRKEEMKVQLEKAKEIQGSLKKLQTEIGKMVKNGDFAEVAKIKRQEDAHSYRLGLQESIAQYKKSIVTAQDVIDRKNKRSDNPDLSFEERKTIAEGLADNEKIIAEAKRGLEKSLSIHDRITDLIDQGNFEEIEQIRSGKKELEVEQNYGNEYNTRDLLEAKPKLTLDETKQELETLKRLVGNSIEGLDRLSNMHRKNAVQDVKEFSELNPFVGGLLAISDLMDGKSDLIGNVEKQVHLSNHAAKISGVLGNAKQKALELQAQGKFREAHELLKQNLTFGTKEQADLFTNSREHYQDYSGKLEENLDSFLETGRKVGIMAVAATVTIASAGTASGITVPIMAGTGAGILFGFSAEVAISQTDPNKSIADGFESAFKKLPGDTKLALETSVSSVIGVRGTGGLTKLAEQGGKRAFTKVIAQGMSKLSPTAQKMFAAGMGGAGSATPGVMKDIAESAQKRVDIASKIRQQGISAGWSEDQIKAKMEEAFIQANVDTKSILHRSALTYSTSSFSGMLGGAGSQLTQGAKNAMYKVGVELSEELLNSSIATLEVMAQGIEPGSPEFMEAVATNIAQAGLTKAAAKAGLDGSRRSSAPEIDTNSPTKTDGPDPVTSKLGDTPEADIDPTKTHSDAEDVENNVDSDAVDAEANVESEADTTETSIDSDAVDAEANVESEADTTETSIDSEAEATETSIDTETENGDSSSSNDKKDRNPTFEELDNHIQKVVRKGEITSKDIKEIKKRVEKSKNLTSNQRERLSSQLESIDTSKLSISELAELSYVKGKVSGNAEQRLQYEVDLAMSNKFRESGNNPQVVTDHLTGLNNKIDQQLEQIQKLQESGASDQELADAFSDLRMTSLEQAAIKNSETLRTHISESIDQTMSQASENTRNLNTFNIGSIADGLNNGSSNTRSQAEGFISDLALSQEQIQAREAAIGEIDGIASDLYLGKLEYSPELLQRIQNIADSINPDHMNPSRSQELSSMITDIKNDAALNQLDSIAYDLYRDEANANPEKLAEFQKLVDSIDQKTLDTDKAKQLQSFIDTKNEATIRLMDDIAYELNQGNSEFSPEILDKFQNLLGTIDQNSLSTNTREALNSALAAKKDATIAKIDELNYELARNQIKHGKEFNQKIKGLIDSIDRRSLSTEDVQKINSLIDEIKQDARDSGKPVPNDLFVIRATDDLPAGVQGQTKTIYDNNGDFVSRDSAISLEVDQRARDGDSEAQAITKEEGLGHGNDRALDPLKKSDGTPREKVIPENAYMALRAQREIAMQAKGRALQAKAEGSSAGTTKQETKDVLRAMQDSIRAGNYSEALRIAKENGVGQTYLDQYAQDYKHNSNPDRTHIEQTDFSIEDKHQKLTESLENILGEDSPSLTDIQNILENPDLLSYTNETQANNLKELVEFAKLYGISTAKVESQIKLLDGINSADLSYKGKAQADLVSVLAERIRNGDTEAMTLVDSAISDIQKLTPGQEPSVETKTKLEYARLNKESRTEVDRLFPTTTNISEKYNLGLAIENIRRLDQGKGSSRQAETFFNHLEELKNNGINIKPFLTEGSKKASAKSLEAARRFFSGPLAEAGTLVNHINNPNISHIKTERRDLLSSAIIDNSGSKILDARSIKVGARQIEIGDFTLDYQAGGNYKISHKGKTVTVNNGVNGKTRSTLEFDPTTASFVAGGKKATVYFDGDSFSAREFDATYRHATDGFQMTEIKANEGTAKYEKGSLRDEDIKKEKQFHVNMAYAKALGINPSWTIGKPSAEIYFSETQKEFYKARIEEAHSKYGVHLKIYDNNHIDITHLVK